MQEDFGIGVSMHAISRYVERTGRGGMSLEDVYRDLKRAINHDVEEWYDDPQDVSDLGFSISYYRKGDRYAVWTDDITKEKMCAIVSADMNVITVMSNEIHVRAKRTTPPKRIVRIPGKSKYTSKRRR